MELRTTGNNPGEPVVRFARIRKSYDRQHYAVDDVTFDIEKGSFLTLLGPSGSGKTTCLHLLAGFETPDQGEIWLEGRSMAGVPPYRRDIGVVFQNYALFPHKTVYENVAYPMRVRRWASDRVRTGVKDALSLVQLTGFETRYPRQLSGGQQQRVAIARAIVFRPAMVLMDEPLGALDRKLREELQREIRVLHKETGLTVLYVTHDQEEALVMSDRVGVMNNGRLEQIDSPNDVYRAPRTRFVANFIGENNFFEGQVSGVDAESTLVQVGPDLVLRARSHRIRSIGEQATVAVRPEFIDMIRSHDVSPPRENTIGCRIEDLVFTGEQLRLVLRNDIVGRVLMKRSTTYFDEALRHRPEQVSISFPSSKAIIL
jgi:putative spermidine/putrescine transport system ATP-binding protein